MTTEILVATGNRGKLREIRQICADLPLTFSSLAEYWNPVPDIPETGDTFLQNARLKAQWVVQRKGIWTLADDSGLEVDALDGKPGVRSARFAGENATDHQNCDLLLKKLEHVDPSHRTARFKCVMVLLGPGDREFIAVGTCKGRIGFSPQGDKGFGYDPLFIPEGEEKTFAQLSSEAKHEISHRGKALSVLAREMHELFREE